MNIRPGEMIIVPVSFYCILLRSYWIAGGGGTAQCRVTSFTMFSSLRGQTLGAALPSSFSPGPAIDR